MGTELDESDLDWLAQFERYGCGKVALSDLRRLILGEKAVREDRDRLRAAIERAVDADDGSCPWMTELQEIALEGHDG